MGLTGGEEQAFRAMINGGYTLIEIAWVMSRYTFSRNDIVFNLMALGYNHTESYNVVMTIYPFTVEEYMEKVTEAPWL